jgi:hypothetical protein
VLGLGRVRSRWLGVISVLAAAIIVYGIYMLQLKQIAIEGTVPVIVPKAFIPAGTLLTEEMLVWKPVLKGALEDDMVTELDAALQMENMVPLGAQEPILIWKLDKFRLLPTAAQATFQIPRSYVLSISSGIRAGDEVDVYVSGAEGESRKLFNYSVKVASAKSSAGAEVDDAQGTNLRFSARGDKEKMYASRREAGGLIDHINLNLTEEEWLMIDRLCKEGANKLVIAFTPASIQGGEVGYEYTADQQ